MNKTLTDHWVDVEEEVQYAHLIAWDGCHKLYLALDEREAEWFRTSDYETIAGTPDEMLATLHLWYERSCPLRFIQSIVTNTDDPNAGFTTLIPQGAGHEDEDDEDDD